MLNQDILHILPSRFIHPANGSIPRINQWDRRLHRVPLKSLIQLLTVSQSSIDGQIGIFDLLRLLNRYDALTVLCVSHDLNLAVLYCDRLVLLLDVRISH